MKNILFAVLVLSISVFAYAGKYKVDVKKVGKDWQTVCETKTSKSKILFIIVNSGKNGFDDCAIEKFKDGRWHEIESWKECKNLGSMKKAGKQVANDGSQVRLRAKSGWGTEAWCHALDEKPFVK